MKLFTIILFTSLISSLSYATGTITCLSGNCINGYGEIQYENGDVYKGYFRRSQRYGLGQMSYANGEKFRGTWFKDQELGKGLSYNKNGILTYSGYWLLGRKVVVDYKSKDLCVAGNCNYAVGIYFYKNGECYAGEFLNGKKEGFGIYTFLDEKNYCGDFKNDSLTGYGVMIYQGGNKYEGNWIGALKNGYGTEYMSDGTHFSGYFQNDLREGKGNLFDAANHLIRNGYWHLGEFKSEENPHPLILDNDFCNRFTTLMDASKNDYAYYTADPIPQLSPNQTNEGGRYNSKFKLLEGSDEYIVIKNIRARAVYHCNLAISRDSAQIYFGRLFKQIDDCLPLGWTKKFEEDDKSERSYTFESQESPLQIYLLLQNGKDLRILFWLPYY